MTIEEKARAYVESVIDSFGTNGVPCGIKDIKHMIAEGYFAGATEALASQWVSVEDGLPEDEETVLTLSSYGPVLAYYSKQDEMWFAYGNYGDITPTHWLPIPPLKGGEE